VSTHTPGFGLIEVIVAMMILTVGILAMGASTGYILNQVRASELRTERMTAVRGASERLHAMEWPELTQQACSGSDPILETDRGFRVTCAITVSGNLAVIRLITEGRAFSGGRIRDQVVDTTVMSVARR
jgi:prepilin-type N-terminal cleavage/methylation domain-containing protein